MREPHRANVLHLWIAAFTGLVLLTVGVSAGYSLGKDVAPVPSPACITAMDQADLLVAASSDLLGQTVDALDAVIAGSLKQATTVAISTENAAHALASAVEGYAPASTRCRGGSDG